MRGRAQNTNGKRGDFPWCLNPSVSGSKQRQVDGMEGYITQMLPTLPCTVLQVSLSQHFFPFGGSLDALYLFFISL